MEIDNISKKILDTTGIFLSDNELLVERERLLHNEIYEELKPEIDELRKKLSSSSLTSLHQDAQTKQRWPLINLIRQILHVYQYKMEPLRKSDGYTKDGVKKYKRFFLIKKTNT
jgi:ribosomal silencing factor RsfS